MKVEKKLQCPNCRQELNGSKILKFALAVDKLTNILTVWDESTSNISGEKITSDIALADVTCLSDHDIDTTSKRRVSDVKELLDRVENVYSSFDDVHDPLVRLAVDNF